MEKENVHDNSMYNLRQRENSVNTMNSEGAVT